MNKIFNTLLFSFFLFFANNLFAQSCEYSLHCHDSYGDGWNGCKLIVTVDGTATEYTIDDGFDADFMIPITSGSAVSLEWVIGSYNTEPSFSIISPDGQQIFSSGPSSPEGILLETNWTCPTCFAPLTANMMTSNITPSSVDLTWTGDATYTGGYSIEYGLHGFVLGSGTVINVDPGTTSLQVIGLAENTNYDFYIAGNCGADGISNYVGLISAQTGFTTTPIQCEYRLDCYDSYGDGWNGCMAKVTVNGVTTSYTIPAGENFASYQIPVYDNFPITIEWVIGSFNTEASFKFFSSENIQVFASGPSSPAGILFEQAASCPTCPVPANAAFAAGNVTATSTDLSWVNDGTYQGYRIEYGPQGFTIGTGTVINVGATATTQLIEGLSENTFYDFYLMGICTPEDISYPVGPVTIQTGFINPPSQCEYRLDCFDSFGDGWNGCKAKVTVNGTTTEYTLTSGQNFASYPILVYDDLPISIEWVVGSFNNEASFVLINVDEAEEFVSGSGPTAGIIYNGIAMCPTCSTADITNVAFSNITANSCNINWTGNINAIGFMLDIGSEGHVAGTGSISTSATTSATLNGLSENTVYEVYIRKDCGGGDISNWKGPYRIHTGFITPPDTCAYFLRLHSEFGGWGNSKVLVNINNDPYEYTLNSSVSDYEYEIPVLSGHELMAEFINGGSTFGISFELLNSDYQVLYASGEPVQAGVVFNVEQAVCPACPAPLFSGISTNNLTPTSVDISWGGGSNNQSYTLEYGVSGYSLGSGFSSTTPNNTVTLEGLNPNVSYDVYVRNNCGGVNGNSIWIGPITFHTPFDQTPDTCSYTLTIQDLLGSGWEGAVLNVENNGINNSYTLDFFEDELTFNIVGYQNQPINFTFVPSVDNNIGRFILTDQSGNEVINQGPMPTTETITTYACPTCGGPSAIRFDDLNGDNVEVSWSSNPVSAGTYQLVYGYGPFTIADGTWINTTEDHAVLTGLNEDTEYNFYIRLLCTSGDSSGWAGPFLYKTRRFNDVGIVAIINPEAVNCSLGQEEIKVRMKNFGALPQTLIPFKYSINGVTANIPIPQDGFYTGVISSDSTEELTFTTIADLSGPGVYEIAVWTELDNDSRRSNDTTRISVYSSYPLPFSENFEDDMLEDGWSSTSTAFDPIGTAHNSGSNVFYQNLYSGQPTVELVTRQYGIVALGDTLSFDYRMVDYPSGDEGTQLGTDDKLLVQISEDCGDNFGTIHVINIANHTTSAEMATKKISLDNFVNSSIIIKFKGVWGVGDYFLDLDNINYLRTVVSNEEVDNQIDKTSVLMYPNPTDEITNVNVTLTKASDIDIDLVNISGQLIQTYHSSKSQVHNVKLDLQNYPLGVYFVRVKPTDGQSVTSKLIKVQ